MKRGTVGALILMFCLVLAAITGCKDGSSSSRQTPTEPEEVTWDSLATPVVVDGHSIAAPLVDFLPDGRMVIAEGYSNAEIEIALETTAGSKTFAYVTSLGPFDPNGFSYPSFIKSVDNNTVLVGDSTDIYTVDLNTKRAALLTTIGNYDATISGRMLYITRADTMGNGIVTRIDLDNPAVPFDVVTGIPGASAGVCLDGAGNLYTGNGYSYVGTEKTGAIKRFALFNSPQDWLAGTPVGECLTAGSLIWAGNSIILVGGGLISGSGVNDFFAALDTNSATLLWKKDPDPGTGSIYKLSAGAGRFAATDWNYATSTGAIHLLPYIKLWQ